MNLELGLGNKCTNEHEKLCWLTRNTTYKRMIVLSLRMRVKRKMRFNECTRRQEDEDT